MKKLLATAALFVALGTSAYALDLGNGVGLDTTFTNTYNVTEDEFNSELEVELNYGIVTDTTIYGTVYADVDESEVLGTEFGVRYNPSRFKPLVASAYVTLDDNFENEQVFVEAEFKF